MVGEVQHRLRVWRMDVNNVRVPWLILLDKNMTVVEELPADRVEGRALSSATTPEVVAKPDDASDMDNPRSRFAKWATTSVVENPIEGSDDLREDFLKERDRILQGGDCVSCDLGKLMRKYRAILEKNKLIKF